MPVVRACSHPGCTTLTMGVLCLDHEAPVTRVFLRGRPFVRPVLAATAPAGAAAPDAAQPPRGHERQRLLRASTAR